MSALMNNTELSNQSSSVTAISANARIDYILRFSKHAILVVDDEYQTYSKVGSQFLGSLSEHHNAAFLSLSPKFNDIQIRCRLIEQLIGNDLFDPEVSLAVSVVNFARKTKESISIVVEQAHHLSLQLLHELSQLAAIAKKTKLSIQVVMLGTPSTGLKIATNKALFQNKLSILSASNGQLLSLNSPLFKKDNSMQSLLMDNKWLVTLIAFLCCLTIAVLILLQQETFTFSKKLAQHSEQIAIPSLEQAILTPNAMALHKDSDAERVHNDINQLQSMPEIASVSDIYQSVLNPIKKKTVLREIEAASIEDITDALTMSLQAPQIKHGTNDENSASNLVADNDYYLSDNTGFVIQIAVFSDSKAISGMIDELSQSELHIYQRSLNDQTMNVITSQRFPDRASAELARNNLPSITLMHDAWIKSIAVINREIMLFKAPNSP
jgi:DamX protein